MVHNDSRQVVQTTVGVGVAGARQVPQQILRHVQTIERKLNEGVHLGAGTVRPSGENIVMVEH